MRSLIWGLALAMVLWTAQAFEVVMVSPLGSLGTHPLPPSGLPYLTWMVKTGPV